MNGGNTNGRAAGNDRRRLRNRRRRLRRLRHGGAPVRGPRNTRRPAGSRRPRPAFLDPRPARLRQDHHRSPRQLVLRDGTGAQPERPPRVLAARQGAGRIVVDQRPGLHPRPERGLRPVAPARQHRLVVRRRAAVFPARRTPDPRRERTARHRRPALGFRHAGATIRSARRSSRARSTSAIRATTTSTALPRKVSATTSSPRATAGVAPPRSAICVRR